MLLPLQVRDGWNTRKGGSVVQVHPRDRNNTSRTWPRPGVRDGRGSRITLSLLGSQPGVLALRSGRIVRPSAPDSKSGERFIPFRGFKSHSLRGGFSKPLRFLHGGLWYSGRMTTMTASRRKR